jgi:hypothetical protein
LKNPCRAQIRRNAFQLGLRAVQTTAGSWARRKSMKSSRV